ncbi:MAG: DNA-binding protein [Alphaproteobacteria bacterium]|nr:DNA-binding protein [Alphaproteobacteria bacterium]
MDKIILHSTPIPELRSMIGDVLREEFQKFKSTNPSPQQTTSEYLSRKEVCKLLKISMATLHYYTKDGILQGYRIGGRVLYKLSEVETAVEEIDNFKGKHKR